MLESLLQLQTLAVAHLLNSISAFQLETKVLKARRAHQEVMVQTVVMEVTAIKVRKAKLEIMVIQVVMVVTEVTVIKESLELVVIKGKKELLVLLALLVQLLQFL